MKKEVMDLKESVEGYMGGIEERKGREKCVIIISPNKRNNNNNKNYGHPDILNNQGKEETDFWSLSCQPQCAQQCAWPHLI